MPKCNKMLKNMLNGHEIRNTNFSLKNGHFYENIF